MPTSPKINRIDLELYLDRLDTHAARLADDLAAARLRLAWRAIEDEARRSCTPAELQALEAIGVVEPASIQPEDDRLMERRIGQIAAVNRLRALVEDLREEPR